jgi:multicomponent Na+:H+ antiporter subunit C
MTVNLTLLVVMGVLYAVGVYLLLERSLTRVLLGLMLLTNGTNLLILHAGGAAGFAPLYEGSIAAIVISLAVTAFLLGMIYRSWVLGRRDEIQDDVEDRRVARQSSYDMEDDADVPADTTEFDDAPRPQDPGESLETPGVRGVDEWGGRR